MKAQLAKPLVDGDVLVLVEWSALKPYWSRDAFEFFQPDRLCDFYLDLWFNRTVDPPAFRPGHVGLRHDTPPSLGFTNGRHRTNLLVRHGVLRVPITLESEDMNRLAAAGFRLDVVSSAVTLELPDLPIVRASELKARMPCCPCCVADR